MMDDMTYEMQNQSLPRDVNVAQLLLQDHLANYKTVHELFEFTTVHSQDVLSRASTSAAVSVSRDEIKGFLEKSEGRRAEWRSVWEHHRDKLEESVRLCEFQQAISTVCSHLPLRWIVSNTHPRLFYCVEVSHTPMLVPTIIILEAGRVCQLVGFLGGTY